MRLLICTTGTILKCPCSRVIVGIKKGDEYMWWARSKCSWRLPSCDHRVYIPHFHCLLRQALLLVPILQIINPQFSSLSGRRCGYLSSAEKDARRNLLSSRKRPPGQRRPVSVPSIGPQPVLMDPEGDLHGEDCGTSRQSPNTSLG